MGALICEISNLQSVGLNQRGRGQAVPIRYGFIVLDGLIRASMFQADQRVLSKGHQIAEEKPIRGFDLVLVV